MVGAKTPDTHHLVQTRPPIMLSAQWVRQPGGGSAMAGAKTPGIPVQVLVQWQGGEHTKTIGINGMCSTRPLAYTIVAALGKKLNSEKK